MGFCVLACYYSYMDIRSGHIYTEIEIDTLSEKVFSYIKKYDTSPAIVVFYGDLGTGKTTLIKILAKKLQISKTVVSPTYTILQSYETKDDKYKTLVHIDAYRIDDDRTWDILKMDELLKQPKTLFCIEWPEKLPTILNYPHIEVHLKHVDHTSREIKLNEKSPYNEK